MLSIPAGLSTTTRSRSKNRIALSGRAPVRSFGARSSTTTTASGETRKAESRQRWPFTVTRPSVHRSRARDHAAPVCSRTIAATVGGLIFREGCKGVRVARRPLLHLEHARLVLGRRRLRPRFLQRRHRLARMDGAAADPVHAFLDVDLVNQGAQRLLARVV